MSLVIKKKVGLEFLGDGYSDAYLIFRSIPVQDYEEILTVIEKSQKDNDTIANIKFTLETLKKYFISGEFPNDSGTLEAVTKDDIGGLDKEAAVRCFTVLTGQDTDPKE